MTITCLYLHKTITTENSSQARALHDTSRFGTPLKDGRVQLSPLEAVYLAEKKKITVVNGKNNELSLEQLTKRAARQEHDFWTRYAVFKDFRNRGYIVKTALKFGADFRVYDRGIKPGEDHAKWVVFAVKESHTLTWQEFAAKNRVAHGTKKKLLIAVVDDEQDVSYWEVSWLRP